MKKSDTSSLKWPHIKPPNIFDQGCSARHVLELIASKWVILILSALADGAMRNGELKRKIGGITQKMLTQTLRDLERSGLVIRDDKKTMPPHVIYSLSPLGLSLSRTLQALDRWAEDNFEVVDQAQSSYDTTVSKL